MIGEDGRPDPGSDPRLPEPLLRALFEGMLKVRILDERMLSLQKQGRIGSYSAATGQEAGPVGAAAALEPTDPVFPSFREAGVLVYRGIPLERYVGHCLGNAGDPFRGRMAPGHLADRDFQVASWSPCVGTQIPHAVGAAYAARLRGERLVVAVFLGDGATSEGDFHAGMNLAGLWRVPVLFLCQNNQWSISVPVGRQTASPSLAVKASAYGIDGMRVDGNDILAVYAAVRQAAENARKGGGPAFLELVTCRMGRHSPSDDPSRYRDEAQLVAWRGRDPIERFRGFLRRERIWSEDWEDRFRERFAAELAEMIRRVEGLPPPPVESLFEDVWRDAPPLLREQRDECLGPRKPGAEKG